MKTTFSTIACTLLLTIVLSSTTKAEVVTLGSNIANWGTVFSDVEREAYYYKSTGQGTVSNAGRTVTARNWLTTATDKVDTWDYRKTLLEDYLEATLANNAMDSTSGERGVLHSSSNSLVAHNGGNAYGQSQNAYGNIYGSAAKTLQGNLTSSGVAEAMLSRHGQQNIISSQASPVDESVDHNWIYNASTDTFTSTSGSSTGVGDHNTGLFAFVTSFNYDSATTFQYLNGWFSELGTLLGVYINGVELNDTYLKLSADYNASQFFGDYDMEIDLRALFNDGILSNGNNNIAFMLDTILPEYYGGTYYDGNDGLVAFASGLNLNTESIFDNPPPPPQPTPEPATMLIVGLGIAGLGLRKKLMNKKSI